MLSNSILSTFEFNANTMIILVAVLVLLCYTSYIVYKKYNEINPSIFGINLKNSKSPVVQKEISKKEGEKVIEVNNEYDEDNEMNETHEFNESDEDDEDEIIVLSDDESIDIQKKMADNLARKIDKFTLSKVSKIEETLKEKALKEKALKEKALKEKTLKEKALKEKTLKEKTLKEKTLQESALKEKTLQESALKEKVLQESALKEKVLQESALKEKVLQESALKEKVLQESALKEKVLQENGLMNDNTINIEIKKDTLSISQTYTIQELEKLTMNQLRNIFDAPKNMRKATLIQKIIEIQ
jgi:uncharacterized protein YjbI with pentapeptide repeats